MVLLALLSACVLFAPVSCGSPPDVGQFGAYSGPFKLIRLPTGDTFTVYRVKYWTFSDSSAPALQLEYQTKVPIADTEAVEAEQRRLWPVFQPYVGRAGFATGILTAADRVYLGGTSAHVSQMHSFGSIADRDVLGTWRFRGDSLPLPAPVVVGGSSEYGTGIFERSGIPLSSEMHP